MKTESWNCRESNSDERH